MPKSVAEVRAELTGPGQLFEMDTLDIRGVPTRVWKNAPPTLRQVFDLSGLHGDKTLVAYEDELLTFAQHRAAAVAFAHRLIERYGVRKGDRVVIAMRNFPEWLAAFWGTAITGAVVVPLNAWGTGSELRYGIVDSGAKVVVLDEDRALRLRPYDELDVAGIVVVRASGALEDPEEAWADVLGTIDPAAPAPEVDLEPDDDATIFYTSGTTGSPKGALGTHRNICTNTLTLAYSFMFSTQRKAELGGADDGPDLDAVASGATEMATLLTVPLFHVTGCHAAMLSAVAFGQKLVMMHKWDPERALELIERERVTTFVGVPSMVFQLLDAPSFDSRDLSSLKTIGYGGAPAPAELVRRIEKMFPGRTPSNGWGMTETSSTASSNAGVDYLRKPDSVGPAIPVIDARIVDASGAEVEAGGLGELWVRGPNVVKGYWNKPEATAETFTDGWLHTGDIARIDDEGFIYIVDRAKDMVIRGGENVYCAEVEAALFEHPDVADCAVFGTPHEVLGEEVGAVVQLKPGTSVSVEALQGHCKERVAGFKVPVRIWFWSDELPRNAAGKILKRDLRDQALARD